MGFLFFSLTQHPNNCILHGNEWSCLLTVGQTRKKLLWNRALLSFTPFPSPCSTFPSLCSTHAIPSWHREESERMWQGVAANPATHSSRSSQGVHVRGAETHFYHFLPHSLGGTVAVTHSLGYFTCIPCTTAQKTFTGKILQQHIRSEFLHRMVTNAASFFTGIL